MIIHILNRGVGLDGLRVSVLEWITTSLNTDLTSSQHSCSITMKFSIQISPVIIKLFFILLAVTINTLCT